MLHADTMDQTISAVKQCWCVNLEQSVPPPTYIKKREPNLCDAVSVADFVCVLAVIL